MPSFAVDVLAQSTGVSIENITTWPSVIHPGDEPTYRVTVEYNLPFYEDDDADPAFTEWSIFLIIMPCDADGNELWFGCDADDTTVGGGSGSVEFELGGSWEQTGMWPIHQNATVIRVWTYCYSAQVFDQFYEDTKWIPLARAPTIFLDPSSGQPETNVTVLGTGFDSDEHVSIMWDSETGERLGSATADSDGSFSVKVKVPDGAEAGEHTIYAVGTANTASAKFSVTSIKPAELYVSGGKPFYKDAKMGTEVKSVFPRTVLNPKFEVDLKDPEILKLHEEKKTVEVLVEILKPLRARTYTSMVNVTATFKNLHTGVSATYVATWDWSGDWDGTGNKYCPNVQDVPVGVYHARAIVKRGDITVTSSEDVDFYVIFDSESIGAPASIVNLFVNPEADYEIGCFPPHYWLGYWSSQLNLHWHDSRIWKDLFEKITLPGATSSVKETSDRIYDIVCAQLPGKPLFPYRDTLKALEKKKGLCTDSAALLVAYHRAIGIPARTVSAKGTPDSLIFGKPWGHQWAEVYYNGKWNFVDPSAARYDQHYYANNGHVFRPSETPQKFWAATLTDKVTPYKFDGWYVKDVSDKYTYCVDISRVTFDKDSYSLGDSIQSEVYVLNTGKLSIDSGHPIHVHARIEYRQARCVWEGTHQFKSESVWYNDLGEKVLDAGQPALDSPAVTVQFKGNIEVSRAWEKAYLSIETYYVTDNGDRIQTSLKRERIPLHSVDLTPSVSVDGSEKGLFDPVSVSYDLLSKNETYSLEDLALVKILAQFREHHQYARVVVSNVNPDFTEHSYSFTLPIAETGDALYLPSVGAITENISKLDAPTNYLVFYEQSTGTSGNLSIYEFSESAKVESVRFIKYKYADIALVNVSWAFSLKPGACRELSYYFKAVDGVGGELGDVSDEFLSEIADNGDSLIDVEVSAPQEVRMGETVPVNVTVSNNGATEETIIGTLNVSKMVGHEVVTLHSSERTIVVGAQKNKTATFNIDVSDNFPSGTLLISFTTDKGVNALTSTLQASAFRVVLTEDVVVEQSQEFIFNVTVFNVWDRGVHSVNASINLFHCYNTPDLLQKVIFDLEPGENRTIRWHLIPVSAGPIPIEINVTSADGGCEIAYTTLFSPRPVSLWVQSIEVETEPPKAGEAKTVYVDLAIQNLGDLTAEGVQLALELPEDVSSTKITWALGNIASRENASVIADLGFSRRDNFAVGIHAEDVEGHIALATIIVKRLSVVIVVDHLLCEGLNDDGTPLGAVTTFKSDETVFSWLEVANGTQGDEVYWLFQGPNGITEEYTYPLEWDGEGYCWDSLDLNGYNMEDAVGDWSVTVCINGVEAFTDQFTVEPLTGLVWWGPIIGLLMIAVPVSFAIIIVIILIKRRKT